MTLIGNSEGKLHVQRQVEDYAFRGLDFEEMGFLSFTVETYERRIISKNTNIEENLENDNVEISSRTNPEVSISPNSRYSHNHPKSNTHYRVSRMENHNSLPNIVGPWLPRHDGDEDTKHYYYASMLAFLKPWRSLHQLKSSNENWETAFNAYMQTAGQRDRDVVAGCQYYYETKNVAINRGEEEDIEPQRRFDDNNDDEMDLEDESQMNSTEMNVSNPFKIT